MMKLRPSREFSCVFPVIFLIFLLGRIKIISAQAPTPTYQPQYLEALNIQVCFNCASLPPNLNGGATTGAYWGHYPITLQRIYHKAPPSYKVVLSIIRIISPVVPVTYSPNYLISLQLNSQATTGFVVRIDAGLKQKIQYIRINYLAISEYIYSYFHIQSDIMNTPTSIDFQTYPFTRSYTSPNPHTDYNIFFVLSGIDIVMKSGNNYIVWTTTYTNINLTNYKLELTGQKAILNSMIYTILYYKKVLQHNFSPTMGQIKVVSLGQTCGLFSGDCGSCTLYNPAISSFSVFNDNYFMGVWDFGSTTTIDWGIVLYLGKLQVCLKSNNGMRTKGFLFYGYACADGYFLDGTTSTCKPCFANCLKCIDIKCFSCATGYKIALDNVSCNAVVPISWCSTGQQNNGVAECILCNSGYLLAPDKLSCLPPPVITNCLASKWNNAVPECVLCDLLSNLVLDAGTKQCICMVGFQVDPLTGKCAQICPDGLIYHDQCDDNNTISNDGCDPKCRFQKGFTCNTKVSPTVCFSNQELLYEIDSILNNKDGQFSAIIILKPLSKNLPFSVLIDNFFTNQTILTHLGFKIIVHETPAQKWYDPDFRLEKVQNNQIHLFFNYQFTVENLKGLITLNYAQTRYLDTTQKLNFVLKGSNSPLEYSEFKQIYTTVQKGMFISTIVSMLGLLVGLFVPKFIGLETIITMQLIYYSQLLISDFEKWPVGFMYFKYLKVATGLSQILNLSQYTPTTNLMKKYQKLSIEKTILENYNTSFLIVALGFLGLCVTSLIRIKKQTCIESYINDNQIKDVKNDKEVIIMLQTQCIFRKITEAAYWLTSQLTVWSILPIMSAIGAEFLINNSSILIIPSKMGQLFIFFRGQVLFLTLFMIFVVMLNHFKNIFMDHKTMAKILEKPEELLYKRFVFVYLFVMGLLIFLCNSFKPFGIHVSIIALSLHLVYTIFIITIKPYKQSLRIHALTLYMNQILYLADLVVINMINFIPHINQFFIIGLGYLIVGSIGVLIILTIVRLYYQIRYGEGLERKLKIERQKMKEEEKIKKQQQIKFKRQALEMEAKKKIQQKQKIRDLNQYLIQTQVKQTQKINLLEWLQTRNWQQEDKDKYYYKKFHQKPLSWMKENDYADYQKRIQQIKQNKRISQQRRIKVKENPEFIQLTNKMRNEHQEKGKKQRQSNKKRKSKNKKSNLEDQGQSNFIT